MFPRTRSIVGCGFVVGLILLVSHSRPELRAQDAPQALVPIVRQAVAFGESEPVRDIAAREAAAAAAAPQVPAKSVYTVPNRVLPNRLNQDYTFPAIPDGALSRAPVPLGGMPGPSLTFEGLGGNDNGVAFGGFVMPPDTVGDVGPLHYVQQTNLLVRIWNKAGAPLVAPFKLSSLFASVGGPCATIDNGDPITLYDPLADRWLLSQFCFPNIGVGGNPLPPYHQMIAISKTGDPTGAYWVYDFLCPGNKMNDYPHFGVWPEAYYMTVNQFTNGQSFSGTGAYGFDRQKLLAGDPSATYIYFDVAGIGGTLPSDLDGVTPPPLGAQNYVAMWTADEFGGADAMQLFRFSANFANPAASTFVFYTTIPVAAFDPRSPATFAVIEQPAPATASHYLDVIGDRLMHRMQYRNFGAYETLVVTHTVNVSGVPPTTPANHQAGVRTYEFRRALPGGSFVVNEQNTFAPDATNRWMGSAAMDRSGNIAVGYSASSTSVFPAARWAGRLATDPAGSMAQGEATMFAGDGVQLATNSRWGDYSSLNVDPADDCRFWYTTEYHDAADQATSPAGFRWNTRIGTFIFPSCVPQAPGTFTGTVVNSVTGGAVGGARIFVDGAPYGATTAAGAFTIKAAPGMHTIRATLPNFTADTKVGTVAAGGTTALGAFRISSTQTGFANYAAVPGSLGAVPDGTSPTPGSWGAPRDVQFNVTGITRKVARVEVSFTMGPLHPWAGDLEVTLISPAGVRSHLIFSRTGFYDPTNSPFGDGSDVAGPYTFTDAATANWWITAAATNDAASIPAGSYRTSAAGPSGAVTSMNLTFTGLPASQANGTWTLRFRDGATPDTGSVSAASLAITQLRKTPILDFDADIKGDFALVRNLAGAYIWFIQNGAGFSAISFGASGLAPIPAGGGGTPDILTPGDYDGDFRTDVGVWRPAAVAAFYWLRSSDGGVAGLGFGTAGDNPTVIGDYDGDSISDHAVVRNQAGTLWWYMMRSTLGFTGVPFGAAGDFVAPGDWDGDGIADQAVRRPGGGINTYFINGSMTGFSAFPWGSSGDSAVNDDYDGDGKTDAAVVRNQGGLLFWYIRRSSDLGLSAYQFGSASTDLTAAADYDGDGKTDVGIWRSSGTPGATGFWYLRSSDGVVSFFPFGQPGDIPVALFNLH
jgi:hypothetical protein